MFCGQVVRSRSRVAKSRPGSPYRAHLQWEMLRSSFNAPAHSEISLNGEVDALWD